MSVCAKYPDHPFYGLTLLDNHELLDELKSKHLTLGLTQQVPLATGVPPHIDNIIVLKNLFDHCTQSDLKVNNYREFWCESVFDVICQKVKAEGSINSIILLKVLNKLKEQLF